MRDTQIMRWQVRKGFQTTVSGEFFGEPGESEAQIRRRFLEIPGNEWMRTEGVFTYSMDRAITIPEVDLQAGGKKLPIQYEDASDGWSTHVQVDEMALAAILYTMHDEDFMHLLERSGRMKYKHIPDLHIPEVQMVNVRRSRT